MTDQFSIKGFPTLDQLCGSLTGHVEESDCRCSRCTEERVCAAEARLDAIKEGGL